LIRPATVTDDRRTRILEVIRQRGFASLPALAEALEVSESTVRRDLDFLEESGVAQRTHGGVFYTGPSPKLAHFDQRQSLNWDKKRLIAVSASRLIEDNETILLDGGSTTYELAQLLVGRPLQVVTNSLPVANLFTSSEKADSWADTCIRRRAFRWDRTRIRCWPDSTFGEQC
jgi:DeoR family transcriptional regulator, fructose operon transcriptional repressor